MTTPVIIKLHPSPEEYEEAEKSFLAAIGLCVNQWSFVDRQLFRLFNLGLKTTRTRAAAVYYRRNSIDQRLTLLKNILEYVLSEDQIKKLWKPIESEFERLVPTRNIIAHHPAKRTGTARDGKAAYIYSIHIEPYELSLNKKYKGLHGKDELLVEDLEAHAVAVQKLAETLARLFADLQSGT